MATIILYLFALLAELTFFIGFSIFTLSLIYSSIKGSPYVPTRNKEIDEILRQIRLSRGMKFYELGSGDARISRRAVKNFAVKAIAIDVNPLLTRYASLLAKFQKIEGVEFKTENIFITNLRDANVIYLFLMPELIKKLRSKFEKEVRRGTIIISHGFKIEGFEEKLFRTLAHRPFPTYYYQMNS